MTTPDQSKGDRSRDEVLAGEYVLGVLGAEERRQVEDRLRKDRQFAAIVHRWEENLSDFNEDYGVELPPPEAFAKVEAKLSPRAPRSGLAFRFADLWNSLAFWRGIALVSLIGIASFAGVEFGLWESRFSAPPMVADLQAEDAAISLVARFDRISGKLKVTPVAATAPQKKSLELWVIDGSKPARSLGVLPQSGEGEVIVPDSLRRQVKEGVVFAVSVEPFGGSPTGSATGPVIASGTLHGL
ncbi:anti-sigma factor [Rhizobium paknamense]|uniref:Anti-sigma-K factor RskA n=1 Tax=Rhizobium paknamense TaxID=1206817 RepID=A0ABU0IDE9_9HYPH|nr:anti-sigma factor [Rhizobium paknamense]MDQ0455259.1 anti-sigma-K factor RskA [Rhizobium paknamense]